MLLWRATKGAEVVIFYIRTNRNITAGEVARLVDGELAACETHKGLARAIAADQWWDFRQFAPHLGWGRIRPQRPPLDLTEDIVNSIKGKVSVRGAPTYTVTGALEGVAIKAHLLAYRVTQVASQL